MLGLGFDRDHALFNFAPTTFETINLIRAMRRRERIEGGHCENHHALRVVLLLLQGDNAESLHLTLISTKSYILFAFAAHEASVAQQ